MQASSSVDPPSFLSRSLDSYCQDEIAEIVAGIGDEFCEKVKIEGSGDDGEILENSEIIHEIRQLKRESDEEDDEGEEEEDDGDDQEFSFVCSESDVSLIAAEDAFWNGQIRPIFPVFNRDLLSDDQSLTENQLTNLPPVKKVFIETGDRSPSSSLEAPGNDDEITSGPFCAWSKKAVEVSPEVCKKSNSTGFSRLRRFRDLMSRSNSDGRDAYVFFNSSSSATTSTKREDKVEKNESSAQKKVDSAGAKAKAKKGKKGGTTSSSAHELLYVRNRASKEEDRRRSYLPYRPELVGFFTNVNVGLSRNVHPF